MKTDLIKKQLLTESAIIAVAIVVLGGAVWYLGTVSEDYASASRTLEGQVQSVSIETSALREKYTKLQKNNALYQEAMQKSAKNQLALNRQAVSDLFNQFSDQYYLKNVHLTMAPIQEPTGTQYKRKTNAIVSSEVSLTLDACSDEMVYSMLDDMQKQLPGSARITRVSLIRQTRLSEDVLNTIARSGACSLVKSEITFLWLGIKPLESDTNTMGGNGSGNIH